MGTDVCAARQGTAPPPSWVLFPCSLLVSVILPLTTNCVRAQRGGREEELQLLGSLHPSPCHYEEETTFHSSTPGVYSPFGIMILPSSEAFAGLRLDGRV